MKTRRSRQRKNVVASSHVEVWAAAGVCSGPSYEAFTIPTPRGLSTIGTPVDTSLTGHKRPASDAENSHDSASFGTLLQHVVVERGDVKDGAFACQQHSLVGGVASARPSQQQASTTGVKQIVLRLSGLRRCPANLGKPSSVKYGESVMNMGTEAEPQQHETLCMQNDHVINPAHPDVQSGSQGSPVKILPNPGFQNQGSKEEVKENKRGCRDDSGGCMGRSLDKSCCVLDSSVGQAGSGFEQGQPKACFAHPSNPGWILNANVCRSCCVPPALNNQTRIPCNACAATRFTSFQHGVPRAVHYISSKDVMVCPAPWVHEGRDEGFRMPDPVYPPGHCNGFADDLDMETQRHLEEQIAQEILLLSQKLANLQARYGARRPVLDNTTPAVLSCPLTPLLLDITRREIKSNPRVPSSSRIAHRQPPESRCQPEERKLGAPGRTGGTNTKAASSVPAPAQSFNRGSDPGVQASSSKSFLHSKFVSGQGNISTIGTRASATQNGCQPMAASELSAQAARGVEVCKPSKDSRTFATSPQRKRRDRQPETQTHVDECSHSDDMKELIKTTGGAANVLQGYPNGSKRFDWVKTLRIAGVRENQGGCSALAQAKPPSSDELAQTSVSKSVQTSGGCFKSGTVTKHNALFQSKAGGSGDVQHGESVGDDAKPAALKATTTTVENESRLKRRPDSSSSSLEHRPGKNGKRTLSPEEMGVLDSRISYHLLKAGMRRAPSLRNALMVKKKTFGSRSPRKDGGKRLRTRTLLDMNLNLKAFSAKVVEKPCGEVSSADVPWRSEVADCEAEYETFVENTDVGGCEEEGDVSRREGLCGKEEEKEKEAEEEEEEEEESRKRSCVFSTPEEKDKLLEVPVLSSVKSLQVPKKTFIRCIDLVVASSMNDHVLKCSNGRNGSGVRYSFRRVGCSELPVHEGCQLEPQSQEGVVKQQALPKLDMDEIREPDPCSTQTITETIKDLVLPELLTNEDVTTAATAAVPSSSSSVVSLASVLSRVIPKQMESMDAAQLRARWEELIDALEKERLGLPKIKTCVSSNSNSNSNSRRLAATATSSSSPRDSGGVKRIAQQQGQRQKDKDSLAPDDVSLSLSQSLWSKVEQKQELVF